MLRFLLAIEFRQTLTNRNFTAAYCNDSVLSTSDVNALWKDLDDKSSLFLTVSPVMHSGGTLPIAEMTPKSEI